MSRMTLQKYERYKTAKYLQEDRIYRLWDEAVRNINEYWFGIPSVPKVAEIVFDSPNPNGLNEETRKSP